MTTTARTVTELPLRKAAVVAGAGLLAMTALSIFSLAAFNTVVVPGDAGQTAIWYRAVH